jgi:phospholipid/cholesterol/gamma-HCH transport system ATP-binding protein
MAEDALIQVRQLTARYGDNVILDDVSLDVYTGEILAILGGSGCGKSTLMRHMVGLNRPFAGTVVIDGVDVNACALDDYQRTLRKIGVLFQSGALFGSMTLRENIALPIAEYSGLEPADVETLIRMKLNLVELHGFEDLLPSELSGGMKKRAGLARAMALNPKILFLDEPSAGLDPVISAEIDELILHINRSIGTTMVIVTHELDSVFNIAQRVVMLDAGARGIIAEGPPRELRDHSDNPAVVNFFQRKPSRTGTL